MAKIQFNHGSFWNRGMIRVSTKLFCFHLTYREIIDRDGGDGSRVSNKLSHKHAARQVPHDGRPVPAAADHHVISRAGGQTGHGLRVSVQAVLDAEQFAICVILPHS